MHVVIRTTVFNKKNLNNNNGAPEITKYNNKVVFKSNLAIKI